VAHARGGGEAARDADALVADVLRRDPPVQNTRRFVARGGAIAGVPVSEGDAILVLLAAAGRPFGDGGHACPGDALALALAAGCLDALLLSDLDRGALADRVRYRPSPNVRVPVFTKEGEE
jgi:cytochrome P450